MIKRAFMLAILLAVFITKQSQAQTPVEKYGRLSVKGNRVVDKDGNPVQLKGMSLFWSQWIGKYYNASAIKWLKDDWCISVIRAAIAADTGNQGYSSGGSAETVQRARANAAIDGAVKAGIYVILDYHSHEANVTPNFNGARKFFSEMAKKYAGVPNVIYETWNEPVREDWDTEIKPYHREIIDTIRKYDPDAMVVCGTPMWCQNVDEAADSPLDRPNVAYTLHYYANTHKQWLRDKASYALGKGVALFVTEYGTCNSSGNGGFNPTESNTWWKFLDDNKLSYCNWSVGDKAETASVLVPGASSTGGWDASDLTESGTLVRNHLREACEFASSLSEEDFTRNKPVCYPNPFSSTFTIQAAGTFEYSVFDNFGRQVAKGTGTESAVVDQNLTLGMYTVQIRYNTSSRFVKVNKN